ncbi:hypothetical protein GCM10012275_50270 [Longimycelium tulufanense]|uniref:DSBA-like thioredoxin domain-containing protein n=1 Tax=Longimycelium tulufanense TaxID=907463 RepID=A0A8J3CCG6_9PSEU|nr:DsbA family oxidoreductase [Longimycelium tulufanense]GGM73525.1 hypothetical protein GCM10012275_50270 [Longimycelium tulufanense]
MRIEVWADVTCPWSFIGKHWLDQALARWLGEPVEVVWLPFQTDPTAPAQPRRLEEALASPEARDYDEEFGLSPARRRRPADIAVAEGLGALAPRWRVNTLDVHRLLAAARAEGGPGLQGELMDRLLRAHFLAGANLGDHDVLIDIAGSARMRGARAVLAGDAWAEEVNRALARGRAKGVPASPTFVVGRRMLWGAAPVEALIELLEQPTPTVEDGAVADFRYAEALLDARDPLGALRLLRPLLAEHRDRAVRVLEARAYLVSAQLRRAERLLGELAEQDPTDDYVRYLLGQAVERQARVGEALRHHRLAAALRPDPVYTEAVARVAVAA